MSASSSTFKLKGMRECDFIRMLFSDLNEVVQGLALEGYPPLFEEEVQENYPFSVEVKFWLKELYASEKYQTLTGPDRILFFEKSHPFLFLRDLATLHNWNVGYRRAERRDQITGLLFSMTKEVAFEATLALCQPNMVGQPVSQWFDESQILKNLDLDVEGNPTAQAWKACAFYYLYLHFANRAQPPKHGEMLAMLNPFLNALDYGRWQGEERLKKACEQVLSILEPQKYQTLIDALG